MTFDRSLPRFAEVIDKSLGREELTTGTFLRDAIGKLTFITKKKVGPSLERVIEEAISALGPYVDRRMVIMSTADLRDAGFPPERSRLIAINLDDKVAFVNLIERRLIGQDWTAEPASGWKTPSAARIVFWSVKGGVGRSTALCVAAAHLASLGRRVAVLDMDLESPGLASLLLSPSDYPEYGSLDWFVENGLQRIDGSFMDSCVATSRFGGQGTLDIVPAVGSSSKRFPENVIPKLGRAYVEDVTYQGASQSFLQQAQSLVDEILAYKQYDAILVDARAGLNESTAASLLGLGADVLLFGIDTPQTFDGYGYLLAYLRGLSVAADDDWRLRLKMVHAKADPTKLRGFRDRAFTLFSETLYEEERLPTGDAFNFDPQDPDAPHSPWAIADDQRYREFDPLGDQTQLSARLYASTFGDFLDNLQRRIDDA